MLKLLEFPISHYCEKARWALDYKGLPYERVALFPGWHIRVVRRLAPKTTVPVLVDGDVAVQGSSAIMSYLDERYPDKPLGVAGHEAQCAAFEEDIDKRVGRSIRRMIYFRLLNDSAQVRHYFMHNSPAWQHALFGLMFPVIRGQIRAKYRIDAAGFAESKAEFDAVVSQLDERVQRSPYLFGDRFSRADITVASLLGVICMPPEHPVPWLPLKDPEIQAVATAYADRPSVQWVRHLYAKHRRV